MFPNEARKKSFTWFFVCTWFFLITNTISSAISFLITNTLNSTSFNFSLFKKLIKKIRKTSRCFWAYARVWVGECRADGEHFWYRNERRVRHGNALEGFLFVPCFFFYLSLVFIFGTGTKGWVRHGKAVQGLFCPLFYFNLLRKCCG